MTEDIITVTPILDVIKLVVSPTDNNPPTPDSWTPTPESETEFRGCCADDESAIRDVIIAPEPLPFELELPSKAKTTEPIERVSSVEPMPPSSPPPKFAYSARSCSSEEIPDFEDVANRAVGTVGFMAGMLVYMGCLCCLYNKNAKNEIIETYNKHTLFSYFWPAKV